MATALAGETAPDSSPFGEYASGGTSGTYASLTWPIEDPELVRTDDRYNCIVHKGLLKDPVQTPCGHRMCKTCVAEYLGPEASKLCPAGEEDCEEVTRTNIFPDPGFKKEINNLLVYCSNKRKGCSKEVKFNKLGKHLEECEYRDVACIYSHRDCPEILLAKDVEKHSATCGFRPIQCDLCGAEFSFNKKQEHDSKECQEALEDCPYKCGTAKLKRRLMTEHKMQCPKKPTECPFKNLGCKFTGSKEEVKKHEKDVVHHQAVLIEFIVLREMEQRDFQRTLEGLKLQEENLKAGVERIDNLMKNIQKELRMKMVQQVERLIIAEQKIDESRSANVQEMQQLQQSIEQLKVLIPQVASNERQVANHEIRMAEMDLRFQMIETASYDGKLLWKIRDFSHRKRDAVQGRTVSLYSQPFYTSRFGYKMCARVYLNGDGIGRGTHMSLYFVVMRGEYDALLAWPFQHRVSLILLDQSPEKRHLKDEFFPDPNSTSFRRPMNAEMNVASGCPLFVANTVLDNPNNHYIKDDMLFIKVAVDISNLPPL